MPKPLPHEPRDLTDPHDTHWTIDMAAAHFGIRRATVEKYIREGLPAIHTAAGRVVRRDQFLDEWRSRKQRQLATRRNPKAL